MPSHDPENMCLSQISVGVPCDIGQRLLKACESASDSRCLIVYLYPFAQPALVGGGAVSL